MTAGGGSRYFFPGGTVELARTLAALQLGDALTSPTTKIEYGVREGKEFRREKLIKAPVT